jgi:uncharacterized LabA/DUF88 family protein
MGRQAGCDWRRLPQRCLEAVRGIVVDDMGQDEVFHLDEIRVYASYNPAREADVNLKRWLDTFLNAQPGYRVMVAERKDAASSYYCRACGKTMSVCPACSVPMVRSREKGIDTAIVTDLLSLAWEGSYDLAVLISADADMIPAVLRVQEKGLKVVNARWPGSGFDLAKSCWASFDLAECARTLVRDR